MPSMAIILHTCLGVPASILCLLSPDCGNSVGSGAQCLHSQAVRYLCEITAGNANEVAMPVSVLYFAPLPKQESSRI